MKVKIAGTAIVGLALFGIGLLSVSRHDAVPPESAPASLYGIDYAVEQQVVQEAFEENKSSEAVAFLQERYVSLGYDEEIIHILEHLVGEELFAREGREGLSLCSTESPFLGCYHGFFALAFPHADEQFFAEAEATCRKLDDVFRRGACIHGIGHGFATLQGEERLMDALTMCDEVSYTIPKGNEMCYTGVFMEYNTAERHGSSIATLPREFEPDSPYAPCITLPELYQDACYLQLGHWWGETDDLRNDFEAMGRLCQNLPGSAQNKERCFRSVGMVATRFASFEPEGTVSSCMKMPEEGLEFCLEEAATLMTIHERKDALEVCGALGESFVKECAAYIENLFCEILLECDSPA